MLPRQASTHATSTTGVAARCACTHTSTHMQHQVRASRNLFRTTPGTHFTDLENTHQPQNKVVRATYQASMHRHMVYKVWCNSHAGLDASLVSPYSRTGPLCEALRPPGCSATEHHGYKAYSAPLVAPTQLPQHRLDSHISNPHLPCQTGGAGATPCKPTCSLLQALSLSCTHQAVLVSSMLGAAVAHLTEQMQPSTH